MFDREYPSVLLVASTLLVAVATASPLCNAEPTPPTVEKVIATWQARTEKIKSFECQYKITEYHNKSLRELGAVVLADMFDGPSVDNPDERSEATVVRLHSLGYDRGNRYFRGDGAYWNFPIGKKAEQRWDWVYLDRKESHVIIGKDGKKKFLKSRRTAKPWTEGNFPLPIKLWHEAKLLNFRKKDSEYDIRKSISRQLFTHASGVDCFETCWELKRKKGRLSAIRVQFAQEPPYRILEYRVEFSNDYPLLVAEIDYPKQLGPWHFPTSWRVSTFRHKDQSLKQVTQGEVLDFLVNKPVEPEKLELEIPPGTLIEELTSHGMIRALQETETKRKSLTKEEYRKLMREMMDW